MWILRKIFKKKPAAAFRYDFRTGEKQLYILPKGAKHSGQYPGVRHCENVVCAGCGKTIYAAESYISISIYTPMGENYIVCPSCYEKEWEEHRQRKVAEKL